MRASKTIYRLVCLLAWVLLTSCGKAKMEMRTVQGGDGLTFAIPKDYEAAPAGEGMRVFVPAREHSRSAVNIVVAQAARKPNWLNAEEKEVDGREIHYLISEEEGGTGGAGLRLKAWVEGEGRIFTLESLVQPDSGGDGDFRAEWAILPTLRWGGVRGM